MCTYTSVLCQEFLQDGEIRYSKGDTISVERQMIKYIFDEEKNGEESYWGMRAAIDTVIRERFSKEGHLRSKRQDGTS